MNKHRHLCLLLCLCLLLLNHTNVTVAAAERPALQFGGTIHLASEGINRQRAGAHQVLVYDSYTGGSMTYAPVTPRSFMGSALTLVQPSGAHQISRAVVYMVSLTTTTYYGLSVNLKFWDLYGKDRRQVFNGGPSINRSPYFQAPFQAEANKVYEMIVDFNDFSYDNILLPSFSNIGVTVNFDDGGVATNNLTSLITYGAGLPLVGSIPQLPLPYGYYRNLGGQTNYNFQRDDLRRFTETNDPTLLALKLYAWSDAATATPYPPTAATIGVYKNGMFYLRNSNSAGAPDRVFAFGGAASDIPLVRSALGGYGTTVGVYRSNEGRFFLKSGTSTYVYVLGNPGDKPLTGHWTIRNNTDGLGVFRPTNGIVYLATDPNNPANADYYAIFGDPSDQAVAGDWNGDGFDSIGVYRVGTGNWYLTNNTMPDGITMAEIAVPWNIGSFPPVVGDWDGDGKDTLGYFQNANGVFVLHPSLTASGTDNVFAFGPTGGLPIAGHWASLSVPPLSGVLTGPLPLPGSNTFTENNAD